MKQQQFGMVPAGRDRVSRRSDDRVIGKARSPEMTESGWIQAKIRKANTLVSASRFRSGRYLVFGLFSAPPLEAAGALEDAAAPAFVALPSMMVANSPPSTDASYLKS